ncbi:uncharacterized protein LOC129765761 [Toxorhynchites rutilus septentrionalis]|uniref:uncharacterized protein LOC129765761 n=1 Tax=Toxorhynchites rutilus septentrionalis TaxID=329112 RepID=UPI0024792A44|nr:uncharacterized protein LOC129765761 [Toxorhynchites rutilus septentrionalis]
MDAVGGTPGYICGIADNMRKHLLLHYMGSETYDVICDKVAPDAPRDKTYQQIVATLEDYFSPRPLEISENFRFNCRRQGDKDAASADETVDGYLVALRRIAVTCNFGAYLETALRNQLVFGMKRNDIRNRLLEKRELLLIEARDIPMSIKLSRKGGAEIEGASSRQDVHAMHHATGQSVQTNYLDQPGANKSDGSAEVREVCTVESTSRYKKLILDVSVNGKFIRFEIDTGSPVSIISSECRNRLFPSVRLRKDNTNLVSYCNTSIAVLGILDACVEFREAPVTRSRMATTNVSGLEKFNTGIECTRLLLLLLLVLCALMLH